MKSVVRIVAVAAGAVFVCGLAGTGLTGCQPDYPSNNLGTQHVNARGEAVQIVVECDVDLGLTLESGVRVDWNEDARTWTVAEEGSRITLKRSGMCGDECGWVEEIVFENTGPCPAFVSARVAQREGMGAKGPVENVTRAAEGKVQLQDWDPQGGIISGRIDAEVAFAFYATFGQ